jgi:hypothetical protein
MFYPMKNAVRRITILGLLWLAIAVMPATGQAHATVDVSGAITSDTTWTADGGPYVLTGDVTVAAGATLTIAPGAVVKGGGEYALFVLGTLRAVGDAENPVRLLNVDVGGGDNDHPAVPYQIEIGHAEVRGGRVHPAGMAGYGNLILRDSMIVDTKPKHPSPDNNSIHLWYPVADSAIERNVFYRSYGVNAGVSDGVTVTVRDNVFAEWKSDSAVYLWTLHNEGRFVLTHNAFLSTDRVAVKSHTEAGVAATHNYWGTTDASVIAQMVRDMHNAPELVGTVVFDPVLAEVPDSTPAWISIREPGYSFRTIAGEASQAHDLTVISSRPWTLATPSWLAASQRAGAAGVNVVALHVKDDLIGAGDHAGEVVVTTDDGVTARAPVHVTVSEQPAATDVSGAIDDVTVWSLAGSPYRLRGDVTVTAGATLFVEPGVVVDGVGAHAIHVLGALRAVGEPGNRVQLRDVNVVASPNVRDAPFQIEIQHADVRIDRLIPPTGSGIYGSLILRDSKVANLKEIHLWYPVEDVYIERNHFVDSVGISAGISDGVNLYVRNNVFERQQSSYEGYYAIHVWAAYGTSRPVVEYNSFLSTDRVAINHRPNWHCPMWSAQNNYWGATDAAHIKRMIYDWNEWNEFECGQTVRYEPFLTGPHLDTPTVPDMPASDPGQPINWVNGHLTEDVMWTAANSPYVLRDDVQVGRGVTLTIDPGAEIRGNGLAIRVYGRLHAVGTSAQPVRLIEVDVGGGDNDHNAVPYQIEIGYAEVRGGRVQPAGMAGYGSLILRDSMIVDTKPKHPSPDNNSIYLWYPVADSAIERNVFYRSYGVNAGVSDGVTVSVRDNVFAEWKSDNAVYLWTLSNEGRFVLTHNAFLSTDRVAVKSLYGTDVMAAHNYWGTADASIIAQMIRDRTNDPEQEGTVTYEPFLTEPHPDTPPLPPADELLEPIEPPDPVVPAEPDPNPDPTPDPDPEPAPQSTIYLPRIVSP